MIVLDVNVLVALFHPGHPHHEAARDWWRGTQEEGMPITAPDLVWVGFMRVVTNAKAVSPQVSPTEAWRFASTFMRHPLYLTYAHQPRVLGEFAKLCDDARATGNLVTDAYIAASARVLGAAVATFDRDFRRFDDLRLVEIA
ncbi:TA system VapC family ribonuclease toxin [Nocardioides speluncae]|uniref:TA system VapC family ribonuclease toxin n=1 Tax=Nocardioides speluncae TaxID=2670337 RepID=UPI00137B1A59|nr:TA system VapC family ribonuclease toxin [Nocardioides speluncae]